MLLAALVALSCWARAEDVLPIATIPAASVADVAFSPDGKLVAVIPAKTPAAIFSLPDGKQQAVLKAEGTSAALFAPDGSLVTYRTDDRNRDYTDIWRPADGKSIGTVKSAKGRATWKIIRHGEGVAILGGGLWEIDTAKGRIGKQLAATDEVPRYDALVAAGGGVAVIGEGYGKGVRVWRLPGGKADMIPLAEDVTPAALSPDGRLLAAIDSKGIQLLLTSSGQQVQKIAVGKDGCYSTAFSVDGRHLACMGRDLVLKVFSVSAGRVERKVKVGAQPDSNSMQRGYQSIWVWPNLFFSPDGSLLATTGVDQTVKIWRFSDLAGTAPVAASGKTPQDAEGFLERARSDMKDFDFEKAFADLNESIRLSPSAAAYTGRAVCRMRLGRFAEAKPDLDQAVSMDPGSADAHYLRGHARQSLGETDAALEDFTAAVKLDPKIAGAHLFRGLILYGKRDMAGTIKEMTAAGRLDPGLQNAWFTRGLAYQSQGKLDEAIADYGMALASGENKIIRGYRGAAYFEKGEYGQAAQELNNADTEDPKVIHGLALSYERAGKLDDAETWYARDCKTDARSCLWAAVHIVKTGDARNAYAYLASYLKVYPNDAEAQRLMKVVEGEYDRKAQEWADAYYAKKAAERPAGGGIGMALIQGALGIAAGVNSVGSGGSSSYAGSSGGSSGGGSTYSSQPASAGPDGSAQTRAYNQQVNQNIEKKLWDMNNPYRNR